MITTYRVFETIKNDEEEIYKLISNSKITEIVKKDKLNKYIKNGGNLDFKFEGKTLLRSCCIKNHIDLVKILIENGADINLESGSFNTTPLMYSASNGFIEITEFLIDNGADLELKDKDSDTALLLAASIFVQMPSVLYLLEKGAKLTFNNDGLSFIDFILKDIDSDVYMKSLEEQFPKIVEYYYLQKKLKNYGM